jgi:hypothetical protein
VNSLTPVTASQVFGRLNDEDVLRLNEAMLVFPGLAISPRAKADEISPKARQLFNHKLSRFGLRKPFHRHIQRSFYFAIGAQFE